MQNVILNGMRVELALNLLWLTLNSAQLTSWRINEGYGWNLEVSPTNAINHTNTKEVIGECFLDWYDFLQRKTELVRDCEAFLLLQYVQESQCPTPPKKLGAFAMATSNYKCKCWIFFVFQQECVNSSVVCWTHVAHSLFSRVFCCRDQ